MKESTTEASSQAIEKTTPKSDERSSKLYQTTTNEDRDPTTSKIDLATTDQGNINC